MKTSRKDPYAAFWQQMDTRGWRPSDAKPLCNFIDAAAQQLISEMSDDVAGEPLHDRLFDLIMRSFELLQPYRAGLKRLLFEIWATPSAVRAVKKTIIRNLNWLLFVQRINAQGWRKYATKTAIFLVFSWAFFVWMKDDSDDLSTTMAAIDKALIYANAALHKITI